MRSVDLFASANRTTAVANSTGDAKLIPFKAAVILLDLTAADGAVGDTLDVFVDVLLGGKWRNAVHFTQIAGNAAAASFVAPLNIDYPIALASDLSAPMTVTSDAAAGKIRGFLVGNGIRGRYTLVDAGSHGQDVTFGLYANLY